MATTSRVVLAAAVVFTLAGCGPERPAATPAAPSTTATVPATSSTPTPTTTTSAAAPATTQQAAVPTTRRHPSAKATPKRAPRTTKAKPKPRYTCDLDSPPKFDGDIITNRSCGYTDRQGRARDRDPWIDDQLKAQRGQ